MPPSTSDMIAKVAPAIKMYHDARFNLGNATSFAPIMIGNKKLPRTAGIDGTRKKKISDTPWIVNALLYASDDNKSPAGVNSSARMSPAMTPPIAKKTAIDKRYM